ncbi:MAG: transposase, partial [Acetatifactor sp.]|nr:transposase [Acetatifactor sp.]
YPMLVSGSENITINLGSPLRLGHRNGTRIAEFDAHLKLLYGKYQLAIGNLARLLEVEIVNPVNCMKGVMDKLGIPRKYEAEAVDLFVAQYGEKPCTAHEIYFGISEILYMLA